MTAADLSSWPYPLAFTYRQFRIARETRERYVRAQEFLEAVVGFVGLVAVGWARRHRAELRALDRWEQRVRHSKGLALGTWLAVAEELARYPCASSKEQLPFLNDDLCLLLQRCLQDRNRYAHGRAPRRSADIAMELRKLEHLVERIVPSLAGASELQVLHVESSSVQGGRFLTRARVLAGVDRGFEPVSIPTSRPFDDDSVVCLPANATASSQLDEAFELGPVCVLQDCPECGERELFYVLREQATKRRYCSFEYGHDLEMERTSNPGSAQRGRPPANAGQRSGSDEPAVRRPGDGAASNRASAAGNSARKSVNASKARTMGSFDAEIRHPEQSTRRSVDLAGSVPRRAAARLVDVTVAAVLGAVFGGLGWFFLQVPGWAAGLMGVTAAGAYECLLASGKRAFDLDIYDVDNGRPLSRPKLFLRTVLLLVEIVLIFPIGVAFYWIARDPARQAWHDRVVRGVVVNRSEALRRFTLGIRRAA